VRSVQPYGDAVCRRHAAADVQRGGGLARERGGLLGIDAGVPERGMRGVQSGQQVVREHHHAPNMRPLRIVGNRSGLRKLEAVFRRGLQLRLLSTRIPGRRHARPGVHQHRQLDMHRRSLQFGPVYYRFDVHRAGHGQHVLCGPRRSMPVTAPPHATAGAGSVSFRVSSQV